MERFDQFSQIQSLNPTNSTLAKFSGTGANSVSGTETNPVPTTELNPTPFSRTNPTSGTELNTTPSTETNPTPSTERTQVGRIRGFDGLRAIAAALVVVYHVVVGVAEAGFIGVDIFFVLSGFLITALLIKEYESTGTLRLSAFWMRRIRRLLPAVVVTTIGATALARIFGGDALVQLRWQTFGSLTGTYNWFQIAHSSSYFDKQSPLLLTNLWSLAVEQQFYWVWPIIVFALFTWVVRRWRPLIPLVLGIGSVLLFALLVGDGGEITRSYVGTDTHAFDLMFGAALALALPGLLNGYRRQASALWGYISWVALIAIIVGATVLPDASWLYPWGMVGFALLTVLVIRGLLPDAGGLGARSLQNALEWRPLVWLGERSYAIYLWHWPLHVIFFYHLPWHNLLTESVEIGISILLAHVSYTYVEMPIRERRFREMLKTLTKRAMAVTAGSVAIILALSATALATEHSVTSAEQYILDAQTRLDSQKTLDRNGQSSASAKPSADSKPEQSAQPKPEPTAQPKPTPVRTHPPVTGDNVTVVGDSVTLASQPELEATLPGIVVDAAVSRSSRVFASIAKDMEAAGTLKHYVVVSLGTNGDYPSEVIDEIFAAVGPDRDIVFVTAHAPAYATWVPKANKTVWNLAKKYPDRVRVADWDTIAGQHPDLLAGDGIHPNAEGGQFYAAEVTRALRSFVENSGAQ